MQQRENRRHTLLPPTLKVIPATGEAKLFKEPDLEARLAEHQAVLAASAAALQEQERDRKALMDAAREACSQKLSVLEALRKEVAAKRDEAWAKREAFRMAQLATLAEEQKQAEAAAAEAAAVALAAVNASKAAAKK